MNSKDVLFKNYIYFVWACNIFKGWLSYLQSVIYNQGFVSDSECWLELFLAENN